MINQPSIHNHAVERLEERFGADKEWLLNELENGRFVWLKGAGDSGHAKKVRSGHLLYLPNKNEYCVVIMDDRSRLAITVLTEEMALKSPWAKGLDEAAKLKAKRIVFGEEVIDGSHFLRLYAEERGELAVSVRVRTVSHDWKQISCLIYKTSISAEQIDTENKSCRLTDDQMIEVSRVINEKIASQEMRPYCELYVITGRGKRTLISNSIAGIFHLDEAESARRWEWAIEQESSKALRSLAAGDLGR